MAAADPSRLRCGWITGKQRWQVSNEGRAFGGKVSSASAVQERRQALRLAWQNLCLMQLLSQFSASSLSYFSSLASLPFIPRGMTLAIVKLTSRGEAGIKLSKALTNAFITYSQPHK